MKVIIDPRARISYASFYIEGLYKIFRTENVHFSIKPFEDLKQYSRDEDFEQYFAFVYLSSEGNNRKVIIDYRDKSNINIRALRWSDIYGKVNFNKDNNNFLREADAMKEKIIPIGPYFGVKLWGNFESVRFLIVNYFKSIGKLPVNYRKFLSGYNWQTKREPFGFYTPSISDKKYVFHISSFYKNQSNGIFVNRSRADFIRVCKKNDCIFEGGLLDRMKDDINDEYKDVITNKYYKPDEYINKIKKSAFVFNTPAAWGCHGWKFGEYLAMGKAIISTPFINQMPENLENGVNILFVKNKQDMYKTVNLLLSNDTLRRKLEKGARNYFEKWLAPEVVIRRLILN